MNNTVAGELEYVPGDIHAMFIFPTIWICGEAIFRNNTIHNPFRS